MNVLQVKKTLGGGSLTAEVVVLILYILRVLRVRRVRRVRGGTYHLVWLRRTADNLTLHDVG